LRIWFVALFVLGACASPRTTLTATPAASTLALQRDERIVALLRDVDPQRLRAYDSALVSFGTRNSYSDTISSTRGIGAARRWIHSQLLRFSADCGGCLRVEYDTGTVQTPRNPTSPQRLITNVLAWLPGRDTSRIIVIGGHYDSCVCAVSAGGGGRDSVSYAPGANDDGSGSSAVIELARVFSRAFPRGLESTVIFALHDAEEQGVLGSTHLARRLKDGGRFDDAGMTDDIVGNVTAEDGTVDSTSVRIFAADPDTSRSRELGRFVWAVGELYLPGFRVVPVWRQDRVGRGGDHTSFIRQGWAGLRFTERLENEKRQHRPTDELAWVNFGYVANVARLNAASIASLGLAPPTPDSARYSRDVSVSGGRRWTVTWAPVVGAAAYEVLVRPTTSAQYERVFSAGTATTYALDVQLDDAWAAIRAVGANGHRSLPVVVSRFARSTAPSAAPTP
jgi:hypothetical protein